MPLQNKLPKRVLHKLNIGAWGDGSGDAKKQMQDAMDLLNADEEEVPAEAA
jgi:hypothetical protein